MEKIFENLDLISMSNQKYIDLSNLSYKYRKNIYLLKENLSFEGLGQNLDILLCQEELIDLLNLIDFSPLHIKFLLNSHTKQYNNNDDFLELFKKTLQLKNFSKNLSKIYEVIKNSVTFDKRATLLCDIIKYLDDKDIPNDKIFKEMVLLYLNINEEKTFRKYPILSTLSKELKLRFSFSTFVIDRINSNISLNYIMERLKFIKLEDFDYLDFLIEFSNNSTILSLLTTLYCSLEDNLKNNAFILKLKNLSEIEKNTLFLYLLQISNKCNTLNLLEFDTIYHIIKEQLIIRDIFAFIYEKEELLLTNSLDKHHIDFIKKVLNKKSFIKLIKDNINIFSKIPKDNILFNDIFIKVINLNTLNVNNLEVLLNSSNKDKKDFISKNEIKNLLLLDENKILTFNELWYLIKQDKLKIKLFYEFYDINLKINLRLKLLKELPNLENKFSKYNMKESEINHNIKKLLELLLIHPYKERINALKTQYTNLKNLKNEDFLFILLNLNSLSKFLQEVNTINDIFYIINNLDEINSRNISLQEFKIEKIKSNYYYEYLIEELELTNDFINKNINKIIEFCEKDLHILFNSFMNNPHQEKLQRDNLKKLVKAELSNRLFDLKFVDSDFDLEIGLKVPSNIKKEWKNNLLKRNKYYVLEETYDFENIIRLGEKPVSTCQHWDGGSYSKCLLSNFDTNKKMIINSYNDTINTRALLRLTKGTFDTIKTPLSFKDIDKYEEISNSNEEIVLFLEKTYSNLDKSQLLMVQKDIINLALEKARLLNIPLIISNYYEDALPNETLIKYNLFISYSKNGCQYLDSLNGQAESISEGSYSSCYVYYLK